MADYLGPRLLRPQLLIVLVLAFFILLVLFGAVGLRGTDQYWYVGDLSMHTDQGRYVSNLLYPSYSLGNGTALPGPIHHVPTVYLAQLWVGLGVSPYVSWVITNLVAMVVSAALIFATSRLLQLGSSSMVPSALFICFPLTYWQTVNALADMALAMGTAGVLFGSVWAANRKSRLGLVVSALSVAFLVWSRDDFALVIVAFLGFCIWLTRSRGWSWRFVALVAAGSVVLAPLKALALPKHPSNGLRGALSSQESMDFYYSLPAFSVQSFVEKAATGLVGAFFPSSATELFTELPILLATGFGLWVTRRHSQYGVVRFWTSVLFITYVAACVLFQAQNRYILPLVPATSVLFVAGLRVWVEGHPVTRRTTVGLRAALVLTVLLFTAMSSMMARHYRAEAISSDAQVDDLAHDLATQTSGPLLAIGGSAEIIPLSHAVLPRTVLAVDPGVNRPESAAELISQWRVLYVLGSEDDLDYVRTAAREARPGAEVQSRGLVHTPGGDLELWSIK